MPDPTRRDLLIVRDGGGAVSLGRGSFARAAGEELAAADLVLRARGTGHLALSPAGVAHLRRHGAEEGADPFAAQHAEVVREALPHGEGTPRNVVAVNAAESPLAWLRRRRDRDGVPFIDAAAFEAGERLRRDLTAGGLLPSVTARWDGVVSSGSGGGPRDPAAAADAVIAARQRARRALDGVGADFADLLIDLCGFLKGLEEIERDRRWPPRSGKVVVQLALRRLSDQYGLSSEAKGAALRPVARLWRQEDEDAEGHDAARSA